MSDSDYILKRSLCGWEIALKPSLDRKTLGSAAILSVADTMVLTGRTACLKSLHRSGLFLGQCC